MEKIFWTFVFIVGIASGISFILIPLYLIKQTKEMEKLFEEEWKVGK